MSDPSSELVEISKLNGDFKRNYGRLIGAYLYLRSASLIATIHPAGNRLRRWIDQCGE
jgi:hypothetical protein